MVCSLTSRNKHLHAAFSTDQEQEENKWSQSWFDWRTFFPRFALVACSSGFRRLLWLVRFCYVWVWVYRIIRNNVGKSAYSFFGWERSEQNVKDTRQFRKLVWVEVECCCSFLKVMYQWKKSYRKMVICLENLMYPWNTSRAKVKICRFPLHPRNSCKQLLSKCGTVFSTRICRSCFRCQC